MSLYISYTTTSHWNDIINEETYQKAFINTDINFVYIHFPYCKKPCYYCCCYKEIAKDTTDNDIYIANLLDEIKYKIEIIGKNNFLNITKMHWGGGTPTLLNCNQIYKVFNELDKLINIKKSDLTNFSIEAYPDENCIDYEKLDLLKNLGFDSISFGIQDFDNIIQKAINRDCKKEYVQDIILYAKSIGLKFILIYVMDCHFVESMN